MNPVRFGSLGIDSTTYDLLRKTGDPNFRIDETSPGSFTLKDGHQGYAVTDHGDGSYFIQTGDGLDEDTRIRGQMVDYGADENSIDIIG